MHHKPSTPPELELSIIIGVLNGADYIEGCLEAVYNQGLSLDSFEILLLDGGSQDDTVAIAQTFAKQRSYQNLHILPNPRVTLAAAFNIGKSLARAPFIGKVDAQGRLGENYYGVLLDYIKAHPDIGLIGGRLRLDGDTPLAKAWAPLFGDPFLVGPARYRYATSPQEIDAALYGIYRKAAMEETGDFDEAILRAEDTDFNYRMRQKGWKIYLQPAVEATYFVRRTLPRAYTQFFNYALWRTMFQFKQNLGLKSRQLLPSLWLAGMLGSVLLGLSLSPLWLLPPLTYLALAALRAATKMRRPTFSQWLQGAALFPTLHAGYALGALGATFRQLRGAGLKPANEKVRQQLGYPEAAEPLKKP